MSTTAHPIKTSSALTFDETFRVAYTRSMYAMVARIVNVKGTAVVTLLQYAASSDSGKSLAIAPGAGDENISRTEDQEIGLCVRREEGNPRYPALCT